MSTFFAQLLLCPSIGFTFILLAGAVRYIFRKKYAESMANLPVSNKSRIIKTDKRLVGIFKIFLWLSPLYLIILPLVCFLFVKEVFLPISITVYLLIATILQEYLFRKWLVNQLETQEPLNNGL